MDLMKECKKTTLHLLCIFVDVGYRVSLNKRLGAYFLHDLQAPAVKRDWAFILEAWHLFLMGFQGTVDLRCLLIVAHLRGF